jgi:3-hydroxymyristoyl/3-hydroxydecanoyl-(acyl carrier protein) dehydratase
VPIDQSLLGRQFPPTRPYAVSAEKVREFATATGGTYDGGPAPATFPIVLAFEAMNAFLDAEQVDLFRIVHGDQKFRYHRPVRPGDVLSATLTVASLRQIGGNDIIGTTSVVADEAGEVVCETSATLLHRAGA